MADVPVKQVIENGNRNYIATYNLVSDGSGLSAYLAADPTSGGDMGVRIAGELFYPETHLKLWEIKYDLDGMEVAVIWDATSDQYAWILSGFGCQSFKSQGGLYVPQSGGNPIAGATGKILFTTIGQSAGSTMSIELWCKKDFSQGIAAVSSGPLSGILTESGSFLVTESGEFLIQE